MKITTLEVAGIKPSMKGMRNPKNSWDKNDTFICTETNINCNQCLLKDLCDVSDIIIGENDLKLATNLKKAGTEHAKYLRMIQVWADFDMPRYWWQEFDAYKIGYSENSCSTMHKLFNKDKEITIDDFVVDDFVKQVLKDKEHKNNKYIFKCILPNNVKLESKEYVCNGLTYEVFNNGEIYSKEFTKEDSIGRTKTYPRKLMTISRCGEYFSVRLGGRNGGKNILVHRLLAELFVDNPNPNEYYIVNHIDGDKGNCSIDNLEWCNYSMNNKHAFDNGLKEITEYHKYRAYIDNKKLNVSDVKRIKELYENGVSQSDIAKEYNVRQCTISDIILNKSHLHSDDYEEVYVYEMIINRLNEIRQMYLDTKDDRLLVRAKRLLPEGFLQLRTVNLNYATIANIYHQRKHHRLKEEWINTFCKWVEEDLPYSKELIIGE